MKYILKGNKNINCKESKKINEVFNKENSNN